jgi:hypothetical protein
MRFATTVLMMGKNRGIEVPPEVIEALERERNRR